MGPRRFVSACVIKVILIGEHARLSIRELLCEMSSNASIAFSKVDSPNCSPTNGKGHANLLPPPDNSPVESALAFLPFIAKRQPRQHGSPDGYSYSKSRCPQTGICEEPCNPTNAPIRSRAYKGLCRGVLGKTEAAQGGDYSPLQRKREGSDLVTFSPHTKQETHLSGKRFGLTPNETKKNRRQRDHHVVVQLMSYVLACPDVTSAGGSRAHVSHYVAVSPLSAPRRTAEILCPRQAPPARAAGAAT